MSRSIRRHHKDRMKKRAKRIMRNHGYDNLDFFAIKNADHLKQCSGWCCKNPRKLHKNGKQGKSKKELYV